MPYQRSAVPRATSSQSRFDRRFWVLVGLLVTAALAGVVSLVAQLNRPAAEAAATSELYFQPQATVVARSYLDGVEPPVPMATGVADTLGEVAPAGIPHRELTWLDAELVFVPYGEDDHRPVEVHRFLVATAAEPLVLSVSMVETVRSGVSTPTLGAVPSLSAYSPDPGLPAVDALEWEVVYQTEPPPEELEGRIGEWAAAYAADDRRTLLELTADQRHGVEYVGLGGWTAAAVEVGGVFRRPDGLAGVHVSLVLAAENDADATITTSFDLVVDRADASLPEIVAWGAAGTALELEPGVNAVETDETTTTTTTAGQVG